MEEIITKYFIDRTDRMHIQFLRYFVVGIASTFVDMGTLFLLTTVAGVYYLVSVPIAFSAGLVANYFMSVAWVFRSTGNVKREFALFAAVGAGGLALTEFIVWLLVSRAGMFYLFAKMIAILLVIVWNFGMRRKFVFRY